MYVRANGAPDPGAVARGARLVFRDDLLGGDGVEQALTAAIADMDAESAENFMNILGAIGQQVAAAAPSVAQGAAGGAVAGPWGAVIGGGLGLANHFLQQHQRRQAPPAAPRAAPYAWSPPRQPVPQTAAPSPWTALLNAPAPPLQLPGGSVGGQGGPSMGAPIGAPVLGGGGPGAPIGAPAGGLPPQLASLLQNPAMLQTLAGLLGGAAGGAPPAREAEDAAAEWLVASGVAVPVR